MELTERIQSALGDAYRIEQELPAGGMSRLFLAVEASLNRRVVVKVLPPEFTSEVSAARFKQEVEVAARLQHPHILPVLGAGARDGLLYYIMPYVAGESLRHRMNREGRLALADATRILLEVADALAFAHTGGIVHRDIKPENILLEGKHAVLADFGIARAIVQSRTGGPLTSTGTSLGTPGYMSPEQLAGEAVDARADVYALAIVGYEMVAGEPPFRGPNAQAVMAAHLTATPPPLDSVREGVPIALSDAIARALTKDPSSRIASAAEFAEAISTATGVPRTSQPSAGPRATGRGERRARRGVLVAVAIAIVAAGLAWVAQRGRVSAATLARVTAAADSGHFDEVATLLAGSDLAAGRLAPLVTRIRGALVVESEPAGADVQITRVTPVASFANRSVAARGRTPTGAVALVVGEYLVRIGAAGHEPMELITRVQAGRTDSVRRTLLASDSTTRGMTLVEAGPSPVGVRVERFLVDRGEVTNAEFQRFVTGGGYRDARFWPDTLLIGGKRVARAIAVAAFVDRSGLPGPRVWSGGRFVEGRPDHPVAGVSWYEAAAYAAWSGKALPTSAQWWRAALGDGRGPYPWGTDGATVEQRANFDLTGTRARASFPLGVSPFGCWDMAGNVREWLSDSTTGPTRRIVVGGSWQDPPYMFERDHAESFDPGFASETIGFRLVRHPIAR